MPLSFSLEARIFMGTSAYLFLWLLTRGDLKVTPQESLSPPRPLLATVHAAERPPLSPFERSGWRPLPPEPVSGYARDRYGYMRPRIVLGPYGVAYYPLTREAYLFYPIRTAP